MSFDSTMPPIRYTCEICSEHHAVTYSALLRHIHLRHSSEPNFRISCFIRDCPKSFRNYHTFVVHVHGKHGFVGKEKRYVPNSQQSDEYPSNLHFDLPSTSVDEEEIVYSTTNMSSVDYKLCLLLLQFREQCRLPMKAMCNLLEEFVSLHERVSFDALETLQAWDEEFDDWIDVDMEDMPEQARKLKAVICGSLNEDNENNLNQSSSMQEETSCTEECTLQETNGHGECSLKDGDDKNSDAEPIQSARIKLKAWPLFFPVPNFRCDVEMYLGAGNPKKGECIPPKYRRHIIKTLFDSMLEYTVIPTSSQYRDVAQALIGKYPSLEDEVPGSVVSAGPRWRPYGSWTYALSNKFRNERVRVINFKDLCSQAKTPKAVPSTEKVIPPGEDSVSLQRHKKILKEEFVKANKDMDKVNHLMELTYWDRRQRVLSDKRRQVVIQGLRDDYPSLFTSEGILLESNRLLDVNIDEVLLPFFRTSAPKVMELLKTSRSEKSAKLLQEYEESQSVPAYKNGMLVVCGLSVLLGGDSNIVLPSSVDTVSGEPTIVGEDISIWKEQSFYIYVEGERMCSAEDVTRAVACILGCAYIFDVKYSERTRRLCDFLQLCVLCTPPHKPVTKTAGRIAKVLCK